MGCTGDARCGARVAKRQDRVRAFDKARADIDAWFDQRWLAPLASDQTPAALWEGARWLDPNQVVLRAEPLPAAGWLPVPSGALGKGPLRSIGAQLKRHPKVVEQVNLL